MRGVNKQMSLSRWALIEGMIRDFHGFSVQIVPTLPELKIEKGFDYQDPWPTFRGASPALRERGVYLIFNNYESPVYIGMASERCLIKRIRESLRDIEEWIHEHARDHVDRFLPRWIDIVPIYSRFAFLAHDLETHLIRNVSQLKGVVLINRHKVGLTLGLDDI